MGTDGPFMLDECLGMQDVPMCNAGAGSNLTLGGHAECDASVMAGDGAFGAVGTVSGKLVAFQALPLYSQSLECGAHSPGLPSWPALVI